jgi:hypothetical protein
MPRAPEQAPSLVCPGCGAYSEPDRRFCAACGLPLVLDEAGQRSSRPRSELQQRARKIKPQLAEGALKRVAWAQNQAEAEFIQSLLLEEGVPSVLRRSAGFDVPDMLAAGPRDVLVAHSGLATAREVLLQAEVIAPDGVDGPSRLGAAPGRLLVGLLLALAFGALVIWLIASVAH